ncbi:MAG: hypothetical protein ASARMPRED_000970 [Alectoria sarmentosa]|nr:MAG: hypothetical protein ASARMPRED_000970 [Alectoria sarmentosa]
MTPAFGFSVGDFISAIGLVKRVIKAFKDTGGASPEYQLVVIELKGLKDILRHLERMKLPKTVSLTSMPFAAWLLCVSCPYETSRSSLKTMSLLWGHSHEIDSGDEANPLRMDSRGEEQHGDLMSKAAEHRAVLHRIQDGITVVEEKVSRAGAAFDQRFDGTDKATSQAGETSNHRFDELDAKFLRAQFKDKFGKRKVLEGQRHIIDVGNDRTVVEKELLAQSTNQGATLTMSMVFCPAKNPIRKSIQNRMILKTRPADLKRRMKLLDEPLDALEVDVDAQLADSPSEHFATDFEFAFYETQNAHEETENNSNDGDEASIYIYRKAGANPLPLWLTQSAVPSMVPMRSYPPDQTAGPEFDLVEQEIKEIEVFDGHATDTTKVEDTQERTRKSLVRFGPQAEKKKAQKETKTMSPHYVTRTVEPSHFKSSKADMKRANSYASLSKSQPRYDSAVEQVHVTIQKAKPILLLGSVFDANSLGNWIYDWKVFCYGTGTPISDLVGDIWLLTIKLAGKTKRIEESP